MLVVVGVLLGLLVLLALPVEAAFRLEGIEAFTGQITIRWLFGLVRIRIPVPGVRERPAKPAAEREAARKPPRRKARRGPARVLAVLGQTAFRRRAYRLVEDLVRAVHVSQLRLRMRLGVGDPADTGRLWAVVGPLNAAAQGLRGAEVQIEPEFMDPVLEFRAQGRVLVVPLQVLALAVSFALSPPSIRAWRTLKGGHA